MTPVAMPAPAPHVPLGPRIELLGTPRLVFDDGTVQLLIAGDAALLALLVLDGEMPRGRIAGLIWPAFPLASAHASLRQRVHRLNRRCGFDLIISTKTLALRDGVQHDMAAATDASDASVAVANAAIQPLLGSFEYDGELGDWLAHARESWRVERHRRLAHSAAALELAGRIADALIYAERLAQEDGTAEHAHRRVMRLHYLRGDRGAALAAFERCRRALAVELGTPPGAETCELAALIERSGTLAPTVGMPTPVAIRRPPRMVGRDAEWRAVLKAWQLRQPALIRGEPGIGKSRLLADVVADAATGHGVIEQRAYPGDARLPYLLLSRLLRVLTERHGNGLKPWVLAEIARLVPEIGTAASSRFDPLRLRRAVQECIAQAVSEGLNTIVIDDMQFADDASIELFCGWLVESQSLAETKAPRVMLALRSGEEPPVLAQWLASVPADSICVIDLKPLDVAAVVELLDGLALPGIDSQRFGPSLARQVGGNPLFLLETLRVRFAQHRASELGAGEAARTGVPRLSRLLDERLATLAPDALRLARVAALAGAEFSVELAAAVLKVHVLDLSDAWVALEKAQVFRDGGFAHDLVFEAALRSVPDALMQPLHAAIAEALTAASAPAARVAQHWRQAQRWAQAADAFEAAARAAAAIARHTEALGFWDAALDYNERAGRHDAAFRVRCLSIESAVAGTDNDDAAARVAALLGSARGNGERLDALLAQCKHLGTLSSREGLLAVSAEALALARAFGDAPRLLASLGYRAFALSFTSQADEGRQLMEGGLTLFGSTNDEKAQAEFASAFANVLSNCGLLAQSMEWTERAARNAERIGDLHDAAVLTGNLSYVSLLRGRPPDALRWAEYSQRLHLRDGEQIGTPQLYAFIYFSDACTVSGRFRDALDCLERGLALARTLSVRQLAVALECRLAALFWRLGQPAKATQVFSASRADDSGNTRLRRCAVTSRLEARRKPPDPSELTELLGQVQAAVAPIERLRSLLVAAELSPADAALAICESVLADPVTSTLPTVELAALTRQADALRRCGLADRATMQARLAVARYADCQIAEDMAQTEFWWLLHRALAAGNCTDEAADALRRAVVAAENGLAHLPTAYQEGYRHRSPVVPLLMDEAARRAIADR